MAIAVAPGHRHHVAVAAARGARLLRLLLGLLLAGWLVRGCEPQPGRSCGIQPKGHI